MNQPDVTSKDRFLSSRQRYQPIALPEDFSNEEMARDWTLSVDDRAVLDPSQKRFRLYGAVQLCAVRLYGRFLDDVPERRQTRWQYRKAALDYLGFGSFDESAQADLKGWLDQQAPPGALPRVVCRRGRNPTLSVCALNVNRHPANGILRSS